MVFNNKKNIEKNQSFASKLLVEIVNSEKFDTQTFKEFTSVLKNFSSLNVIEYNVSNRNFLIIYQIFTNNKSSIKTTDNLIASLNDLIDKGISSKVKEIETENSIEKYLFKLINYIRSLLACFKIFLSSIYYSSFNCNC